MALNVGRWFKYAQAKLEDVVSSSHAELDDLEAEQRAASADRPWLASDRSAPSYEEARARITGDDADATRPAPPDAEVAAAQVELDRRDVEARERLEAIRKELGVEPPSPDGGS